MSYKLIVLDIDGTLTNNKKEITKKTKEALIDIQKKGIKVALASGRPTPGTLKISEELQLKSHGGYILSYNGAKVIDCTNNKTIFQKSVPEELIPQIYQAAIENKVGLISYENGTVICGTNIDTYIEKEAALNHMPIKKVDNFPSYITFNVCKCLMTAEETYLQKVEERLKHQFKSQLSIYRSEPYFLELMPKNVDKAYSISKLIEKLNITKEEVIAVGDGYNDLSMIKYAGLGVAMSNAQDTVKESADFITLSNEEDGVAYVIEKFIV